MLHLVLADQHFGRFPERLEQLLPHGAGRIHVELLLQIGDPRFTLFHHQATAGFFQPGDDLHLGRFARPIDAHQANPVAGLDLPGDVTQDLTGGIDLADAFEAEHGVRAGEGVVRSRSSSSEPSSLLMGAGRWAPAGADSSSRAWLPEMIKRLEQVAALVVAAGLAIVSYWLFFSWAGGGQDQRPQRLRSSEPAAGLQQPLLAVAVVEAGDVVAYVLGRDRQIELLAQFHDSAHRTLGVLEGLAKEGLGQGVVAADPSVELSGMAGVERTSGPVVAGGHCRQLVGLSVGPSQAVES